ncbi:MAG: hypothetical protein IKW49_05580, partial [Opitutales bacterium]|nr:hypothetical protein [Opitutales bacterium]
ETAPYKYPRVIEFVEELPKTISGKIRRVELREKVQEFVAKIVPDSLKDSAKEIVEKIPFEDIKQQVDRISDIFPKSKSKEEGKAG